MVLLMSTREKVLIGIIVLLLVVGTGSIAWLFLSGRARSNADVTVSPAPAQTSTTTQKTTDTTQTTTTDSVKSATPDVKLSLVPGFNLIAIPYILSPSDGKSVFYQLDSKEAYYIDSQGKWISLFDSGTVSPGSGYWVKATNAQSYTIPVATKAIPIDAPFTITLKKGWNAIGNPFPQDVVWNPVIKTSKGTTDFAKAVEAKIITVAYVSDPVTREYTTVNAKDTIKKFAGMLIQSGGDVDLILSP